MLRKRKLSRRGQWNVVLFALSAVLFVGLVVADAFADNDCICIVPASRACDGIIIVDTEKCDPGQGCKCVEELGETPAGTPCVESVTATCTGPKT